MNVSRSGIFEHAESKSNFKFKKESKKCTRYVLEFTNRDGFQL